MNILRALAGMRRRVRSGRGPVKAIAAAIALTANLLSISPASAQSVPTASSPTPPVVQMVDQNGIDLLTGSFTYAQSKVSIGTSSNGGLTHSHGVLSALWADENTGGISLQAGVYSVSMGLASEQFTSSSGVFTAAVPGSTLAYNSSTHIYTYTNRDGVVATYSGAQVGCNASANVALLGSVAYPNGIVITYTNQYSSAGACWGLLTVSTNTGYMEKYINGSSQTYLLMINNSIDYCSPTAAACTGLTQSWPEATINNPVVSGSGLTINISWSTTDPLNRAISYAGSSAAYGGGCNPPKAPPDFIFTLTETSAAGVQKAYAYGDYCGPDANRIKSVAFADGGAWSYTYVPRGLNNPYLASTSVAGPNGQSRTVAWQVASVVGGNPNFNIQTDTDSYGNVTSYTFDTYGRVTSITYPEGNIDQYAYDSRGNVLSLTKQPKPGSALPNIVTSATYDTACAYPAKCNKANSTTDANGNVTNYTYDNATGLLLTVARPAVSGIHPVMAYSYGQITTYAKNGSGVLVSVGSIWMPTGSATCATSTATVSYSSLTATVTCSAGASDEIVTTTSYAGSNNAQPTQETTASGDGVIVRTIATAYDMIGNVATQQGPLGTAQTTAYVYDAAREQLGQIGPHPDVAGALPNRATRTTYNLDGLPTLVEHGTTNGQTPTAWSAFVSLEQTVTTYDLLDRKATVSQTANGATSQFSQFTYDNSNRLTCTAVRMNPATFGSPPSSACTLGTAGSYGPDRISYSTYDNDNRPLETIDAYGVTGVQSTTQTLTYTANGKVQTQQDANTNLTTTIYDGFDRVSKVEYPNTSGGGSSTTDYEQYTYDSANNVTQDRRRDGQVNTITYDVLERKSTETLPLASSYAYDNLNRPTSATRGTQTLSFSHDALGREIQESGTNGAFNFQFDLDDNRTRLTWPDGYYATYVFDLVHEVTAIEENGATSGAGLLAQYSYNNLGQRSQILRGNGVNTTYGYDSAWRLQSLAHAFPTTSNNETYGFIYSPADQLASISSSNSAYDWPGPSLGSLTYTIDGQNKVATAGSATYGYDGRGNLTSNAVNTYGYDASNNLISFNTSTTWATDAQARLMTITDLTGGVPNTNSRWLRYDGEALVAEYGMTSSDSGVLYTRHVPGPEADENVLSYNGTTLTQRTWWVADHLGSTIAGSDVNGNVTGIDTYDGYGVPGSSNIGRFQYTGQIWVPEVELYHYKSRDYAPLLGRFMQTDSAGYADGLNWYLYAENDPINHSDPTGEDVSGTEANACADTICSVINNYGPSSGYLMDTWRYAAAQGQSNASSQSSAGLNDDGSTQSAGEDNGGFEATSGTRGAPPPPLPEADGRPHSVVQRPGPNGRYTTYDELGPKLQYRGEPTASGAVRHGVARPNVKVWPRHAAGGRTFTGSPTVRAPGPTEIPKPPPPLPRLPPIEEFPGDIEILP